jgi:RHS repeat-associated protein
VNVRHNAGTNTLDGASYSYDDAGNRTSRADYLSGSSEQYAYDNNYQLTQTTQNGNPTEIYTYDGLGNRVSSLGMDQYNYDTSNELISTPTTAYTYDHNGNRTSKADPGGTTIYTWSYDNRLMSVTLPGTAGTVSFVYDPFGRRIQKTSASGTITYLYDELNRVSDLDSNGVALTHYSQAPTVDQPLAEVHSGVPSFFEQDGSNSITSLSSITASLIDTYVYDSFGTVHTSTGALTNNLQFSSRDFDAETGLLYLRARYYDPAVGRFVSEDPQRFAAGLNFYSYVGNNPANYIDPSGERDVYVAIWNRQLLSGGVGHVAVVDGDGNMLLSQFPTPHGMHGINTTLDWDQTVSKEGRDPDRVFDVFVPDDDAFDQMVDDMQERPFWDWNPSTSQETNCVNSAAGSLNAGGVPVDPDYYWPGNLGDDLATLANQTPTKGQPWKVTPINVNSVPKQPLQF